MELDSIYRGDCKTILSETFDRVDKYFADAGATLPKEFVDLIYMDPPFFSNRQYEQPWGDESKTIGFDDNQWGYGVDGLHGKYLPYMRERIQRCYNVLKKTGSFYLHCDWHASHYLKQICDDIFGYNNFRNEIIWCYSGGGIPKNDFPRKHDSILRYTKSNDYTFNIEYRKYSKGTLGIGSHSPLSGYKPLRAEGTPITDWWTELKPISGFIAKSEKLGYPTQKPEGLLERIIKVSSNPNEIVLDPFCGCGTTIAVAQKLGRHYIGIDLSEKACSVMMDRLKKLDANPRFHNSIYTVEQLKELSPMLFQDYIIDICLEGRSKLKKTGDKGIDGFTKDDIPIQVKQSTISRPVVDEFETAIDRYYNQLGNTIKNKEGLLIGHGLPPDSVWREIKEAKEQRHIDINFMNIQDCCDILNTRIREAEKLEGWTNQKKLGVGA